MCRNSTLIVDSEGLLVNNSDYKIGISQSKAHIEVRDGGRIDLVFKTDEIAADFEVFLIANGVEGVVRNGDEVKVGFLLRFLLFQKEPSGLSLLLELSQAAVLRHS